MANRSDIIFTGLLFLLVLLMPAAGHASIQLEFDYSYDSSEFFGVETPARASLEAVGDFYKSILLDDLLEINSQRQNNFTGFFWQPGGVNSGNTTSISGLDIAADTIRIYVGAYDLGGNTLGWAGPGWYSVSGTSSFQTNAITRGEGPISSVEGSTATEFAPWGGSMAIDIDSTWNYDYTVAPVGNIDLYSVMLHEIGHVLGLGTADSWDNLVIDDEFQGAAAVAEYGDYVPIDIDSGAHWAGVTTSTAFGTYDSQTALMVPTIPWNTRRLATDLDVAGLDDIGWDIDYPLTPAWIQAAGGLFSQGSNWNTGTKPLSTDAVEFHLPDAYTVTFDANESSPSVLIDAGTVAFNLAAHTYTVDTLTVTGGSTRLDVLNGTLSVATEATVGIGSEMAVGGDGVFRLDGTLDGNVAVDAGGAYELYGTHFGSIDVNAGGTLSGNGLVDFNLTNAGTVEVGSETEHTMDVGGDFIQTASGKLLITLDGEITGTSQSLLDISGTAYLDGELEIVLTDGFATETGMIFRMLRYDGYVGGFENIIANDVQNMHTLYSDTGLFMFVAVPGDANVDGIVDGSDATILANNWLSTDVNWPKGDFNGDGIVNEIDATLLAANMQSSSGAASVPAPSAGIMLLSSLVMLAARAQRKGYEIPKVS